MNTNDCREFLVNSKEAQQAVLDRYSFDDYEPGDLDQEQIADFNKIRANAKKPQKWKRQRKYKATQDDFDCLMRDALPDCQDAVIREFWLEDTDHVTILLAEKEGKIIFIEDISD